MIRITILSFFLFICTGWGCMAQVNTKLDLRLWNHMQEAGMKNKMVALLVKGDAGQIKMLTEEVGGVFKYNYGNISSVSIPSKNVLRFADSKYVERIENTNVKGVSMMDTSRINSNVDSVHEGYAPLISNYKGRGVIVGIIDGGIYWQHMDFRNPSDSSTRIRYIWDQVNNGSGAPAPYNYGNQWSWIDIDNGNCTHVPPGSDFSHGTCVAGIAAGNSHSTQNTNREGQLTGVAPESEIIAVRIKYGSDFLSNVADAVDYIFKKADALGKPCVVNTSIGTYYGSRDGLDLTSQLINAMVEQKKGRVVVAAGGNGGHIPYHLGYTIPADSAFTYFKYNTTSREVYFDLWADTANFTGALFAVGCNDTLGNHLGRTEYFNVPLDFNPPPGTGVILSRNLFSNNAFLGLVQIQATLDEGRYHIEFLISPANTSHYWRLQTSGNGKFDLWSSAALIGSADMTSFVRTGDTANPQILIQHPNYRHSDFDKTVVSSWQCSDKVITVGNYSNRAGYLSRDSVYINLTVPPYNEVVGQRFFTSSFGPTRDERLKPDIMAPGSTTISTGDANTIAGLTSGGEGFKVFITRRHMRNGGTSMASPLVAGIAALYLEKRPTATYDEIKKVLIWTAVKDSFTGSMANAEYGNGKVNAFAALTYDNIVYGALDTACKNYNPLANIDSGGCIPKVYGCMDTTANNYNPLANVSNNSCSYSVGIISITEKRISVNVVPNPFSHYTTFHIEGLNEEKGSIRIFNQLGSLADEIHVGNTKSNYVYYNKMLAAGVYYYILVLNGEKADAGKLVIE